MPQSIKKSQTNQYICEKLYNGIMFNAIFQTYSSAFDIIPTGFRTVAAIIVVIILIYIFLNFVRKSIVWFIIFLLLVPTALPAVRQIGLSLYNGVIQPLLR